MWILFKKHLIFVVLFFFYIFLLKLDLELCFLTLLSCLLKILEERESVREECIFVWRRRDEWREKDLSFSVKYNLPIACIISDSSWDQSTEIRRDILRKEFICVCYVCYCTTWISVLCIFLTHREADMVKLHALHIDVVVVSLFQVSWVKRTLAAVSYFTTETPPPEKSSLFPIACCSGNSFLHFTILYQYMSIKMQLVQHFFTHQISVYEHSSAASVATDPAHCIWKQAYISQELFHRDSQAEK